MDFKTCAEKTGAASFDCIPYLFQNLVNGALVFAGVFALLAILYGAIKYILSAGDAKQVETAQKTLTFAIGGLILVLFSFLIINLIGTITGVDCITMFGFDSCK